jgi:hypothetical protein
MLGFIDTMRAEGHAVESIVRVLREQGVKIAARTCVPDDVMNEVGSDEAGATGDKEFGHPSR